MYFRTYDKFPVEAKEIRTEVFVKEQKFQEEFDSIDEYATHIIAYEEDKPIAVCRYFQNEEGKYVLGRLAVIQSHRGKNVGAHVIAEAERQVRELGGESLRLHSQLQAQDFYAKQGYIGGGEIEYEEFCPHIWMTKNLV